MNNPAHHWIRKLEQSRKPAYLTIPDLIEEDLASGRLRPRDRLPGLRDLADALCLNYTTVARGYAEARKRGLLDARAGSGTFVRGRTQTLPLAGGSSIEMSMNMPPEPPELAARLRASAANLLQNTDPYQLLRYQDFGGTAADRAAGIAWLRHRLPDCTDDTVLVCPGIHSALVALVSQLARPGDMLCLDSLAYPGIKAIASQLGVRLQALARDDEGPLPHAFEALCKVERPGGFYCNPTLQNPSTLTLSMQRREALADVALRYNVPIIEDEPYGMLPENAPAALAALAPELTYHVTGLSKTLGAGLRVAYLKAPTAQQRQRAHRDAKPLHRAARDAMDQRRHRARHAAFHSCRGGRPPGDRASDAWRFRLRRASPRLSPLVADSVALRLERVGARAPASHAGHRRGGGRGLLDRRQSAQRAAPVPRRPAGPRGLPRGVAARR